MSPSSNISPESIALISSETRLAEVLLSYDFRMEEENGTLRNLAVSPDHPMSGSATYYQALHDNDAGYRDNNWLLPELAAIVRLCGRGHVAEIGCGNGRFTKAMSAEIQRVHAFDWARSPNMEELPFNVTFHQGDVRSTAIPPVDAVCSADVLEHFAPSELPPLIEKFSNASPSQHHVIACYDDGHSHLTVMPPGGWLALFRRYVPDAFIERIECRRGRPDKLICVISTTRKPRRSTLDAELSNRHLEILLQHSKHADSEMAGRIETPSDNKSPSPLLPESLLNERQVESKAKGKREADDKKVDRR